MPGTITSTRQRLARWAVVLATTGTATGVLGQQMPPAPVIVSEVVRREVAAEITLVGTVQGRRNSMVASETNGLVVAVMKEAGQSLRTGDGIIRLENDQLRTALIEALADVKLRRFNAEQSAQLRLQEAVSEQTQRDSEYELDRAAAKLALLRDQIDDLEIQAPFNGYVVQTFAELGEWVERGEQVAQVISIDTVRVRVDVPERHVDGLQLGATVGFQVDALGSDRYRGRIVAILAQGLPDSRAFPVIVEALNPGHRMRGGMAARVAFSIAGSGPVTLVHKDALVTGPTGTLVFLALDDKATARPVTAGMAHQGYVAVDGEIEPGDLVIVRGNERLREGQAIQIIRRQE